MFAFAFPDHKSKQDCYITSYASVSSTHWICNVGYRLQVRLTHIVQRDVHPLGEYSILESFERNLAERNLSRWRDTRARGHSLRITIIMYWLSPLVAFLIYTLFLLRSLQIGVKGRPKG